MEEMKRGESYYLYMEKVKNMSKEERKQIADILEKGHTLQGYWARLDYERAKKQGK